ncbi:MAG: MurR/RpiR family transcriptional regulator [Clostridia bacterium]|nr:MurR/RpiR family transcriptional regulator [Clostridia bacterium]
MKKILKDRIIEDYEMFSTQEKKVAKYVVDHYKEVLALSGGDLARNAGVSEATVVRFAKTLGYKGFLQVRNELKDEHSIVKRVSSKSHNTYTILDNNAISDYYTHLENDARMFCEKLDVEMLERLCRNILDADTVYVHGLGSDRILCEYLYNYLPIMGIRTVFVGQEGIALKDRVIGMTENDFVIFTCFPSVQESDLWFGEYIKETGAKMFMITDSDITARVFGVETDYVKTKSSVDTFFNSPILSMYFCDILLMKLKEMAPERAECFLKKYDRITGQE